MIYWLDYWINESIVRANEAVGFIVGHPDLVLDFISYKSLIMGFVYGIIGSVKHMILILGPNGRLNKFG